MALGFNSQTLNGNLYSLALPSNEITALQQDGTALSL